MQIVLCLNHFMPQQVAGTEVYTWALAKSLKQKGHQVNIVIPNYGTKVNDEYVYDGLSIKQYAEPSKIDRTLIRGERPPDGIEAFERLIKEINPDVVHIQELAGSSGIGMYHLRSLKKMLVKVLLTMHLARYSCFSGTLMYMDKEQCNGLIDIKRCSLCALNKLQVNNFIQKVLYNVSIPLYDLNLNTGTINHSFGTALSYPFTIANLRNSLFDIVDLCEKVIVLTEWYKKVLLENGVSENKMCLVKQALPYPVSTVSAKSITKKNISLVFIGRIAPIKGLHLLLDAIKEIGEDEVTLDIFGGVNDIKYFGSLKGITEGKRNIAWKGLLPQKDVVSTIRKYDALVLPSTVGEMSPLVIQEAFAAGLPVIGSNVAGIAEQIQDKKNGLLFEFQNSSSLRDILLSLIRNPTLLNDLTNNITHPNDFESVVEQMLKIYQTVLNPNLNVKNSFA